MADRREYVKLERRLTLVNWLNSLFGYKSNQEMLRDIASADEGFDSDGLSYIFKRLTSRGQRQLIDSTQLERYDENIKHHLEEINKFRTDPITLRYFQYLALLYAEIYIDRYFNQRKVFLAELNRFVKDSNAGKENVEPKDVLFTEEYLRKLAFWMATGSGKTLIMHFNYRQFLHYNKEPLDNILMITPNEGLTEQHIAEMIASGITCERFNPEESRLNMMGNNVVLVTEITKLVEEKKGSGQSVDVECFEGNNLIFVDEGHKGSGGEVWRKMRNLLEQTGFTFEYSATFGQALTATRNDELTKEYGMTIIFDYSYKYFYDDGFGKDFYIQNLQEETSEEDTQTLLTGNLLSFFEQVLYYKDEDRIKDYNIEFPLWVFVGSKVNAVYTENRRRRSDVLTVARFLNRFCSEGDWAVTTIEKLLKAESGLKNERGDIFQDKLGYLRNKYAGAYTQLYYNILNNLFHHPSSANLHLVSIKGSDGELGLRIGNAEDYFGLIYIGDTSAFKNLVEEDDAEIILEDDAITGSLFNSLGDPESKINMLIGAKKFMEGWNSWRVSNMGLLNIGRSEGSEIIQLFGRGVRLKGKDFSLKRSSYLSTNSHPKNLKLLETLNIFAVRANYMTEFRDYLEREGVDPDGYVEIPLKIRQNEEFLKQNLQTLKLPDGKEFVDQQYFQLEPDRNAKVIVDLSMRLTTLASSHRLQESTASSGSSEDITDKLDYIDWNEIYLKLIEFKEEKGFRNLIIRLEDLKAIIEDNNIYQIIADDKIFNPQNFSDRQAFQEAVLTVLKKYADTYYRRVQKRWESENMKCVPLEPTDENFQNYLIKINKSEIEFLRQLKELIDESNHIYEEEIGNVNIIFDRHLYVPLLIDQKMRDKNTTVEISPPGLNKREKQFLEDLRKYSTNSISAKLGSKQLFLLRNQSRGKGVGFSFGQGFYPDFILWIKDGNNQRIVFIESHGMMFEKHPDYNDKIKLRENLTDFEKRMHERGELKGITLDSYIISATEFESVQHNWGTEWDKDRLEEHHVLFFDNDGDYIHQIFS